MPGLPAEWAGLRALAVDLDSRGQGIGRQLTEACVLRAWRIGRSAIALHNAAFQSAARRLYLAMGFERCPQFDFDVADLPDLDLKGRAPGHRSIPPEPETLRKTPMNQLRPEMRGNSRENAAADLLRERIMGSAPPR
jgi:hypothetical protein